MRIGLTAGGSSVDRIAEQAVQAEADGFTSLWFPGAVGGDPLVAMALAGRSTSSTSSTELGTAVADQITALFAAGATDVWAAPFPVGDDRSGSRRRTRALLAELAAS